MRPSNTALATIALLVEVDLRKAFRRNLLGPLWNSVALVVAVTLLGLFFGTILKKDLIGFAPYVGSLAIGLIVWDFLSGSVNQCCALFSRWMPVLRHSPLPFHLVPLARLAHNLPLFVLNLVLFLVGQALFLDSRPDVAAVLAGFVLVVANVGWMAVLGATLAARYRDFGQMASGALHVVFLLTPVVWVEHFLGRYQYLLAFNPFYYPLVVLRQPLLGEPVAVGYWVGAAAMAVAGTAAAAAAVGYGRRRLPFWI
jgi:lipopolysaccharide transport system permease protein